MASSGVAPVVNASRLHKLLLGCAASTLRRLEAALDSFRRIEKRFTGNRLDSDYRRYGRLVVAYRLRDVADATSDRIAVR